MNLTVKPARKSVLTALPDPPRQHRPVDGRLLLRKSNKSKYFPSDLFLQLFRRAGDSTCEDNSSVGQVTLPAQKVSVGQPPEAKDEIGSGVDRNP
jgi:hypothetical protein